MTASFKIILFFVILFASGCTTSKIYSYRSFHAIDSLIDMKVEVLEENDSTLFQIVLKNNRTTPIFLKELVSIDTSISQKNIFLSLGSIYSSSIQFEVELRKISTNEQVIYSIKNGVLKINNDEISILDYYNENLDKYKSLRIGLFYFSDYPQSYKLLENGNIKVISGQLSHIPRQFFETGIFLKNR